MEEKEFKRLLLKAESYCVRGERAPLDVVRKLESWSEGRIDQNETDLIIARLMEEKYLDVERYVSAFISDKVKFNRYGPIKIRYALREKGIDDSAINDALNNVEEEEWIEILTALLTQKQRSIRTDNPYEIRDKLFRSAYSRGFPSTLINRALRRINMDEVDDMD